MSVRRYSLTCSIFVLLLIAGGIALFTGCGSGGDSGDGADASASQPFTIDSCDDFHVYECDELTVVHPSYDVLGYLSSFYWGACGECGRAQITRDQNGCIEAVSSISMTYTNCAFVDCSYTDCTIDGPVAAPINDAAVTDGLLAYYPFEGEVGTAGSLVNCACFSEGIRGAALAVHGNFDEATVRSYRPATLTVAAWVYLQPQITENCCPRIYGDMNWEEKEGFSLYFQSDGSGNFDDFFAFSLFDTAGTEHVVTSQPNQTSDRWHHVAATYDGTTLRFYHNGTLADESFVGDAISHVATGTTACIGGENANGNGFTGKIDDAAVYDRALTGEEIRTLYQQVR